MLVALILGAAVAAIAGDDTTRTSSIFAPVSAPADAVRTIAMLVLAITAGISVIVGGLLAYSIVRFRLRSDDDGSEPPQVYGSDQIEVAWTVIPVLIVVVLCLVTARTVYDVQDAAKPPGAIDVTIVGHQWWWEIRYPTLGVVTANELHVPVSDPGDPTPTFITLASADVAHSFWVPRLAGKTDLIPNRTNRMWIAPREPGLFRGQCAEYCGTQHAHMSLRVYVQSRSDFERWVATQRPPAAADPAAVRGRRLFETTACINCHAVRGTVATGRFGPDLTHLMSRTTLVAGAAPMAREALRAWIDDPDRVKPGALMPAMKLDPQDLDQLVDYLATLK
jgi:cytochrome c oxidase subunit II